MYNNGYPATYQPQYYSMQPNAFPTQNSVAPTQPTQSGIIWVQGEAAAKSYAVAPNTSVALWDSEANVIYIKSADASGMPSMKIVDYTMRDNAPRTPQTASEKDFATKDDLLSVQKEIDALKAKIKGGDRNAK